MITIRHKHLSVAVSPEYGSNMTSFKVSDHELIYCDKKLLKNYDFTGNFVIWPLPNRVKDRKYKFNDQEYFLKNIKVPRGNYPLIHGLVRNSKWQYKLKNNQLTTWIDITPQFQYWQEFPWLSRLTLNYSLNDAGVKINYQVSNYDNRPMPFGFALHPFFKNVIAIKVPAKHVMETDDELLPTGKLLPARLNQFTNVDKLNLDDVFTNLTGGQVIKFNNGITLNLNTSPDFTHCVVYTHEKERFICIEPQTCSTDAHNLADMGLAKIAHLIVLKPQQTHQGWLKYEIS